MMGARGTRTPSFAGKHVGARHIGGTVKGLHTLSGGWIARMVLGEGERKLCMVHWVS